MSMSEAYQRGMMMGLVEDEAKRMLSEYAGKLETSKPEIASNLKEFAREEIGIVVEKVVVWDQGTIDLEFGPILGLTD